MNEKVVRDRSTICSADEICLSKKIAVDKTGKHELWKLDVTSIQHDILTIHILKGAFLSLKLKTKYDRESELVTVSQDTMYDKLSANTNLIVQFLFFYNYYWC